ncbi:MAG TPA: CpaF family protein [Polyangiaceae bacterium]|jgi:pilus assembly protein CpaF|nr:CpaF family protein [Polyangiaceae bacterium]
MTRKAIFEETLLEFFAPIRPYLDDPTINEIMINGPDLVYVERDGLLEEVPAQFADRESLLSALRNLSQYIGKPIDENRPILEGRLPDGSRVEAVIPPVAPDGPVVSIRRFFRETLTVERLVELGAMTGIAAASLQSMVRSKLNIMVSGGTGSGKTSMLNALSGFIPDGERVVIIEDSREIQFHKRHVIHLEARPADRRGKGAVTIRELFRATLRMRADRVVVGEVRGEEALDMVQAMTSGHGGCMSTLHSTQPTDTLARLETMCMMSDVDMPLAAMRQQIGSGVQLIVHVGRMQDGTRKVTHITEVLGYDAEHQRYQTQDLFTRTFLGLDDENRVVSDFAPTGTLPSFMPQLMEHGTSLPDPVLELAHARRMRAQRSEPHG